MLRVRLDIYDGTYSNIGELHIVNDGSLEGTGRGAYNVTLKGREHVSTARVESFDRGRGAWALVAEAIAAVGNE